jgi:hypothetical protein
MRGVCRKDSRSGAMTDGDSEAAFSARGRRSELLAGFWRWARVHLFRIWTALLVLATYGYLWVNDPEYLTWWKRSIDRAIEKGCGLLPYPWGDRIESTLGDFGLWVQLTLTILLLRALVGIVLIAFRRRRPGHPGSV